MFFAIYKNFKFIIKKYFKYNNEYISGWTYLLGILLSGVFLILFVVPGIYFASITAYERSMSLKWPIKWYGLQQF
mgnify:CR=1 FL=1